MDIAGYLSEEKNTMGAFGPGPMENDTAWDYVDNLVDQVMTDVEQGEAAGKVDVMLAGISVLLALDEKFDTALPEPSVVNRWSARVWELEKLSVWRDEMARRNALIELFQDLIGRSEGKYGDDYLDG